LRLDYRDHGGSDSIRTVKPHRLVCWGRRWCLLAWDTDRQDWRTFRVDRLEPAHRPARGSPPATCPTATSLPTSRGACGPREAVSGPDDLHAPAATIAERIPPAVGLLEAVDERTCLLDTGADTLDTLAVHLGCRGRLRSQRTSRPCRLHPQAADRYRHATR